MTRQPNDMPNVLYIVCDQHNAKVLGHNGHLDVHTPNLDCLASQGVRFANAITQNPICTPSRVSFLSGQYCHNHGYFGLEGANPGGLPNVLGHFRNAGYTTAAVGKIHCPEYWVEDTADFYREATNCSIGGNPEYERFIRDQGAWDAYQQAEKGQGAYGQKLDGYRSRLTFRQSPEGWINSQAMQFFEQARAADRPFFAHVSYPRPHQTYTPCGEFWDLYDPDALTLPANADIEQMHEHKAPHLRRAAGAFRDRLDWVEFEPRTYEAARRRKLRGYLGNVSQVDHAVGELLDWLDRTGLADNTIVVYFSDHGDYATEHGLMEKAPGICSDAITRVPLIVRRPGHYPAGHTTDRIIELIDLPATLCAEAGLEPMQSADGRDASPLWRGEDIEHRRLGVTEHVWSKSIRMGRWRYVYYPREFFADDYPDGFGELYDLDADPWEKTNLYFHAEHQATIDTLRRELFDWLVTTTRPKTVNGARPSTGPQALERYHATINADGKFHPDRLRGIDNTHYR